MLQWLEIPDDTSSRVLNGTCRIKRTDLHLNPLTLRDSFGTDEANIKILRAYFDSRAFDDFESIVNANKKLGHYTCPNCAEKCHAASLLCAGCLLRWHHECVSSSHAIKGEVWFCQSCEQEIDVQGWVSFSSLREQLFNLIWFNTICIYCNENPLRICCWLNKKNYTWILISNDYFPEIYYLMEWENRRRFLESIPCCKTVYSITVTSSRPCVNFSEVYPKPCTVSRHGLTELECQYRIP